MVTVLTQNRPPPDPIAPGALYETENTSLEVFPLHKLIAQDRRREYDILTFETYETPHALLVPGTQYELRTWWPQHAMDALLDPNVIWESARYEGEYNEDEMCLFTWENMADKRDGYYSSYGWITAEAFDVYIKQDLLRMRSGGSSTHSD